MAHSYDGLIEEEAGSTFEDGNIEHAPLYVRGEDGRRSWRRLMALPVLVTLVVCFGLVLVSHQGNSKRGTGSVGGLGGEDFAVEGVVELDSTSAELNDDQLACSEETKLYAEVSADQPDSQEALRQALNMLTAARSDCGGVDLAFPYDEQSFSGNATAAGQAGGVEMWHKYASSCTSETYKIHFMLNSDNSVGDTSFTVEVNQHTDSGSWELLSSNPSACDISTGETSVPMVIHTKSGPVVKAANFAAQELQHQLKKKSCDIQDATAVKYTKILSSVVQVTSGLHIHLRLMMAGLAPEPKEIRLAVQQDCGLYGRNACIKRLQLPDTYISVCDLISPVRRLDEESEFGEDQDQDFKFNTIDEDLTEIRDAQRQWIMQPRELKTSRAPLMERYIKTGAVPAIHDDISGPCFQKLAVYDQGQCGSCYAQAVGQMTGIRKCLYDLGNRGQAVPQGGPSPGPAPAPSPLPTAGGACPADCYSNYCFPGDPNNGGIGLTAGKCHYSCSHIIGGRRYCGYGSAYKQSGSVACTGCAGNSQPATPAPTPKPTPAPLPAPLPTAGGACPAECYSNYCFAGDPNNGGIGLTGGKCIYSCSHVIGGRRYCGFKSPYHQNGHIDCSKCGAPVPTPAPTPPQLVTNGQGPAPKGTPCTFPFKYWGMVYKKCYGSSYGGYGWCSTGGYDYDSKKWGGCASPSRRLVTESGDDKLKEGLLEIDNDEGPLNQSMAELPGRRLTGRSTKNGCKCKRSWSLQGYPTCNNYCCNPDGSSGDWCFTEAKCSGTNWGYCAAAANARPTPAPAPADCKDSTTWSYYGAGTKDCKWFAKNDPGCTKFDDEGQFTHCKVTCKTCPVNVNNPWKGAWYQYMPSPTDIAGCSRNTPGGQIQGCDGGNLQGAWNNFMRSMTRPLWVMGETCKPYEFKCFESSGVVNPMSSGMCSSYQGRQLWHKPCSCIPKHERPSNVYCPSDVPTGSCAFPIPPAFFVVKSIGSGLSNAEAVLNIQRHILEFGPVYVAFKTTTAFMSWPWNTKPVYTGGGQVAGGHAVIMTGWGTQGVNYWRLRNSWARTWAEQGYCKFQRGINLDDIEGRSIGAVMPTSDFKDWSPPSCQFTGWKGSYSYRKPTLSSFTFKPTFKCSKACSLTVFFSNKLTNRNEIYKGVNGVNKHADLSAGGDHTFQFDIAKMCFGVGKGDMWMKIKTDDRKGNTNEAQTFTTISASGMSKGPCSR